MSGGPSSGPPTIERATAADVPACVALRSRTRENAVSEEALRRHGITAESWGGDVGSGRLVGWVARRHGELVGHCFGDVEHGEIVVLALLPHAEGRGLGRRLLERVVADLAQRGHARLFLQCAATPSVRSHGFYRHLGWRGTGVLDRHGDERLERDVRG